MSPSTSDSHSISTLSLGDEPDGLTQTSSDEQHLRLDKQLSDASKNAYEKQKIKVLIIGDEYAKNFAKVLDLVMDNSDKEVEEVVNPKMELCEITRFLFEKTIKYGKNDYVIIMFNTNNISNNRSFRFSIKNMLPVSKVTNLIILSELNKNIDKKITNAFFKKVREFTSTNRNISLQFFIDEKYIGTKYTIINNVKRIIMNKYNKLVIRTVNTAVNPDTSLTKQFFRE